MSIKIRQNGDNYRVNLDDEEWQFNSRKEMEAGLKILLDMKDKKGKLPKENK